MVKVTDMAQNHAELPPVDWNLYRNPVHLSRPHRVLQLELESISASQELRLCKKRSMLDGTSAIEHELTRLLRSSKSQLEAIAKTSSILPKCRLRNPQEANSHPRSAPAIERKEYPRGNIVLLRPYLQHFEQKALFSASDEPMTLRSIIQDCQKDFLVLQRKLECTAGIICKYFDVLKGSSRENAHDWKTSVKQGKYGDPQVTPILVELLREGEASPKWLRTQNLTESAASKETRQATSLLNTLSVALVKCARSLRYRCNAQKCLRTATCGSKLEATQRLLDTDCGCKVSGIFDTVLSSHCGHMICKNCFNSRGGSFPCFIYQCRGLFTLSNSVHSSDLELSRAVKGKRHHTKVNDILTLILSWPREQQILLFIQYSELSDTICAGLKESNVSFDSVTSAVKAASILKDFKNKTPSDDGCVQVLVMDPFQSSAAGQ